MAHQGRIAIDGVNYDGTGYFKVAIVREAPESITPAQAIAQIENGEVVDIIVSDGGSGYTSVPTVTLEGGGGSGATARASANGQSVTAITVTGGGRNYRSPPTVVIADPPIPTVTLWSNDDSSLSGGEPTDAVPVTISQGHYSFGLGDISLTNMRRAISADTFAGIDDAYLRIWFSTSMTGPFEQLTPDRHFTTGAYAFEAAGVSDGAITSEMLASGSVTSTKLAADSVSTSSIADGAIIHSKIAENSITAAKIVSNAVGSSEIIHNAVGTDELINDSVTSAKIAPNTITGDDITSGLLTLQGDLQIGASDGANDDSIYFDFNRVQRLVWDDSESSFQFTSPLIINGVLNAGGYGGKERFNYFAYVSAPDQNSFITSGRDLYVDRYLQVQSAIFMGDIGLNPQFIYFSTNDVPQAESISWSPELSRFSISNELFIASDVHLGSSSGTTSIFFGGVDTAQSVAWDATDARFEISQDLEVSGDLFLSSSSGDGTMYFGSDASPERILWQESAERFVITDNVYLWDALNVGGGNYDFSSFLSVGGTPKPHIFVDSRNDVYIGDSLQVEHRIILGEDISLSDYGIIQHDSSLDAFVFSDEVRAKSFTPTSDRDAKEVFTPIDSQEMLAKVAALEITHWQYKEDPLQARHVGPVAQDFYAAFGVGSDDKGINTLDADGVALAAIQGLNAKVEAENQRLKAENQALNQRLEKLESVVEQLLEENASF